VDDQQVEFFAGDLLFLDRRDLADAVLRISDVLSD
jgi:hypothetical protein